MKKTYSKPTIECERYAPNEYVSACRTVRCLTGGETMVINYDPNIDWLDWNGDGFGYYGLSGNNYYSGTIAGRSGENPAPDVGGGTVFSYIHYVTVDPTPADHPNHS